MHTVTCFEDGVTSVTVLHAPKDITQNYGIISKKDG
jgi:hypothetical protein